LSFTKQPITLLSLWTVPLLQKKKKKLQFKRKILPHPQLLVITSIIRSILSIIKQIVDNARWPMTSSCNDKSSTTQYSPVSSQETNQSYTNTHTKERRRLVSMITQTENHHRQEEIKACFEIFIEKTWA
jgi:CHAD domain-containing protein